MAAVAVTILALTGQPVQAGPPAAHATVDGQLLTQLAERGTTGFLVYLKERADLSGAAALADSDAKAEYVYKQLVSTAERSQRELRNSLTASGASFRPYWITNAIWVNGNSALVNSIASRGDVQRISPSKEYPVIAPTVAPDSHINAIEWGLTNIGAPQVWSDFGVRGEGIVVANIDTGVEFSHPAVVRQYRGNLGSGVFDHNFNWFDPAGICPTDAPCDNNDHGTHTMGTMVGDDGASNQIGVAPGAKWIAAKGCETNSCSDASLLAAAQWVLAPTDLNGNNPRPDLHADIVNNSWGGGGGDLWYEDSVDAWITAGMFPSFSNGNSGPGCNTAGSPGDYPQSYAAGAYDINNVIASFSSRGSSAVDGGIKPNIAAPGVNVRSSVPGGGYANFNGTSMAAPHVSGAIALIWSAAPTLKGDIDGTKELLDETATDTSSLTCGGTADDNNIFGEGRLNVFQAVTEAPRGPNGRAIGTVTNSANGNPIAGATVSNGDLDAITGADGRYSLQLPVGSHTLTATAFGFATETATVVISEGTNTTQNFALDPQPLVTVSGKVTDGSGQGWPLYAKIQIDGVPGSPFWSNPGTGNFSIQLPGNSTYHFTTTSQIPGYQVKIEDVAVGGANLVHNISVPVDSACTAPGYASSFGTPVLSEQFSSLALPAGWTLVNRLPIGSWQFNDPGARGNLTGGTGGFAIMDSDRFGIGNTEDSDLITPTLDLSAVSAPFIRFNNDYRAFPNGFADLDVSINGGATWTNLLHRTNVDARGPRLDTIALTGAGGQSNVKVRFRMSATWAWWWEVDNVDVLNRICAPQPGGLVTGFVSDANTGGALNGATVTSNDNPANRGTSVGTPDDPTNPDGWYWLFSSLTGSHGFTAVKAPYQNLSKNVNVPNGGTARLDFALKAGRLTVTPANIEAHVPYNAVRNTTLTVRNTGTAPAAVSLVERGGAFDLLGREGAALVMQRIEGGASKGMTGTPNAGVPSGPAPQIDPAWAAIANYPITVMDNAAATGDGKIYVTGGGTGSTAFNQAYSYDPATNAWTHLPNLPSGRGKPASAFVDGKLYVFGGWDDGGVPVSTVDIYDPASNSWSTASAMNPSPGAGSGIGVLNGKIYLVGGCLTNDCVSGTDLTIFDPATGSFSAGADYPHPVSWNACGGINNALICAGGVDVDAFTDGFAYNPGSNSWSPIADLPLDLWGSASSAANGLLVLSGGVTDQFSTVTNRTVAYDPATDEWLDLPNAMLARYRTAGACGFFKIGGSSGGFTPTNGSETLGGLAQCDDVTDVPWLSETPASFTLNPGQQRNVTVTLTSKPENGVIQPGKYTASIGVRSDTPYAVDAVPVEMNVSPPPAWGKIEGTVLGQTCGGALVGINAFIRINTVYNPDIGTNLRADNQGNYGWWLQNGRYDIIVAKDGWVPEVVRVKVDKGFVKVQNFILEPFDPCPAGLGGI